MAILVAWLVTVSAEDPARSDMGYVGDGEGGGNLLRILDKASGELIHQMPLPAMATGVPMTYMLGDRQFVVIAVGAAGVPAELIALALP